MKRVLLTGASGFVGSHVLRHFLINTDWEIVCPVTFDHHGIQDRIYQAMNNIENAKNRVKIIHCNLAYPLSEVAKYKFGNINYVFNLASQSHVDRSIEEPAEFIMNNVALICHLLDWARNHEHLEKFIQISTDEVYGPAPAGHAHQEWIDNHLPSNPYSASKAAQEDIAFAYWRTYDIPLIMTNTMNIIGEMQDSEKFVPMVIKKILNNEVVTIHGSADKKIVGSRFYLHARNQADALLHVSKMDPVFFGDSDKPLRFNIAGQKEVSNLEMAQMIAKYMNRELDLNYEIVDFHSSRPGHDLRYALDSSKLYESGWEPKLSLEESLKKTVEWTINHQEWLF